MSGKGHLEAYWLMHILRLAEEGRRDSLIEAGAPPARWLPAHPPLLCEEGNTLYSALLSRLSYCSLWERRCLFSENRQGSCRPDSFGMTSISGTCQGTQIIPNGPSVSRPSAMDWSKQACLVHSTESSRAVLLKQNWSWCTNPPTSTWFVVSCRVSKG